MDAQGPLWSSQLARARDIALTGVDRFRSGTRGLLLPMLTWPLLPDLMIEVARGRTRAVVAAALGLGLPVLAMLVLRRGDHGATRKAAMLVAAATGLVAGLGAQTGPIIAVLLGAGAWLGTRLLYDGGVPEAAAPPVEAPMVEAAPPGLIADARARLARLAGEPRLAGAVAAMVAVLDDLDLRPDRLPQARRFLTVHLDGLERIADRLAAGATPPSGLPPLLADLQAAAEDLRARLHAEETAALDIQVKVLADRLRQEGYA